jgi:hypothetical protein
MRIFFHFSLCQERQMKTPENKIPEPMNWVDYFDSLCDEQFNAQFEPHSRPASVTDRVPAAAVPFRPEMMQEPA